MLLFIEPIIAAQYAEDMLNHNLVKAEILWTRKCPLSCSYCNMATGEGNSRSIEEWKLGIDQLKELNCDMAAFYGAEPLVDFEKLPEVVGYAESIGINTTVITSGCIPEIRPKLKTLFEAGAKSISMSYDIVALDNFSRSKMLNAISHLCYFQSLGDVRDVAAIVTLTRKNYMYLPNTIQALSQLGIWTFFDFVHPDRGQPGTKCKGNAEDLVFRPEDITSLRLVMDEILTLKEDKFLVHTSKEFVDQVLANNGNTLINYNWNCARHACFPSWITINQDGSVHYCDDFQEFKRNRFDMTSIVDNWEKFVKHGKRLVATRCRGCCWNTHIDAHLIKQGNLDIHNYIHGDW